MPRLVGGDTVDFDFDFDFILAEMGLLERRRATTHWLAISRFRRRFAGVELLRRAFLATFGLTPSAYRARFRA